MADRYEYGKIAALCDGTGSWHWSVGTTHWRLVKGILQAFLPGPYAQGAAWESLTRAPSVEWAVAYSLGWGRGAGPAPIRPQELGEAEGGAE